MPNNLTDNEIIKALEKLIALTSKDMLISNNGVTYGNVLDLINRTKANERHYRRKVQNQKEELKRLNEVVNRQQAENKKLQDEYRWLDQESES